MKKKITFILAMCLTLSILAQEPVKKSHPKRKIIWGAVITGAGIILAKAGFESGEKTVGWVGLTISLSGMVKFMDGLIEHRKNRKTKPKL